MCLDTQVVWDTTSVLLCRSASVFVPLCDCWRLFISPADTFIVSQADILESVCVPYSSCIAIYHLIFINCEYVTVYLFIDSSIGPGSQLEFYQMVLKLKLKFRWSCMPVKDGILVMCDYVWPQASQQTKWEFEIRGAQRLWLLWSGSASCVLLRLDVFVCRRRDWRFRPSVLILHFCDKIRDPNSNPDL